MKPRTNVKAEQSGAATAGAGVDPLELPFDQYQRYRLVSDLVESLRAKSERFDVLDVGGRTGVLREFLPHDRVTLVDLEPSGVKGLVLGDGSRLPFADQSFDVVAAFDTLEHVPPARRAAFLSECARVARRWAFIAGPYRAPEVDEAERLLQSFLRDKLGLEHRYLEEHRHNGLPDMPASRTALEKSGARTVAIGHGNLERWLALMCAALYLDHEPGLRPLAARIFRFYNANLYASDHHKPVYRHVLVAAFHGAKLPDPPKLEEPRAPDGVLEQFTAVMGELAAFDRTRDEWKTERERLWTVVGTLEKDLAGHRDALAFERSASGEAHSAIDALRADLEGHKTSLSDAFRSLADERAANEHARGVVERDLALARDAHANLVREVEDLRAQRTRLANEVDSTRAAHSALELDLDGHRGALAELRGELAAQSSTISELEKQSALAHEHAAGLVAQLATEGELRRRSEVEQAAQRQALSAAEEKVAAQRAALHALELTVVQRDHALEHSARTLAQRAEALADRERVLVERARVIQERDQELVRQRKAADELRADLEGHRGALRDVRADLAGHRDALRDLGLELERERAESSDLREQLAQMQHGRNVAEQALAATRAELVRTAQDLDRANATIAALRQELARRWNSLLRALGPRRPMP